MGNAGSEIYVVSLGFYTTIMGVFTDKRSAKELINTLVEKEEEFVSVDAYLPNTEKPKWSKSFTNMSGKRIADGD